MGAVQTPSLRPIVVTDMAREVWQDEAQSGPIKSRMPVPRSSGGHCSRIGLNWLREVNMEYLSNGREILLLFNNSNFF